MPATLLGDYAKLIKRLQRSELDEQGLRMLSGELEAALNTAIDLKTHLPIWLSEVTGVSRFWDPAVKEVQAQKENPYLSKDILAGLNGQKTPLYFLVHGQAKRIRLFLGTDVSVEPESGAAIRSMFSSQYPGLQWFPSGDSASQVDGGVREELVKHEKIHREHLAQIRSFLASCQNVGVITGAPTPVLITTNGAGAQIDRLNRGLYGTEWAYMVLATPVEDGTLQELDMAILGEQIRLEQEQGSREWQSGLGQPVAYYYHQLLSTWRQFLDQSLFEGGWWVQSYICSPDRATYYRAKGLVKTIFSGDFSRLDRIRVTDSPGLGIKVASFGQTVSTESSVKAQGLAGQIRPYKYHTLVSSGQLAAMVHLPRLEMPGFYIRDSAVFDVSAHVPEGMPSIEIGEILDRGYSTGNPFRVRIEDLTRHCLLVGITGAGKTNTSFHLIQQLQRCGVRFLIIEPAKREYRRLLELLGAETGLQVFTVGEEGENAAPFRLNPFEIRPGVAVQSHIDLLKSVFNASFGMWSPLPQVLERAIHEVYRDKGWDPVLGTNERAAFDSNGKASWHPRGHPTLTDLGLKIGELVPRLGYEREVERNVKTALETRINSLRVGAKGMVLDTPLSIPMECLLEKPTLLELEGVGDDDEKAFFMGLILIALYEHYRFRTKEPRVVSGLRHLTVIEEAHRLLANAPASADAQAGNPRGKAVETFVSMLSEVRAYGEGFLIAEQIPTKLAPDVIKNTALKIMHRVVSNDDREAMGGAMNLQPTQLRQIVSLGIGQAVVHGGGDYGDDNAILVKVPPAKGNSEASSAQDVRRSWEKFRDRYGLGENFLTFPTCAMYCDPPNPQCTNARRIAEERDVEEAFARMIVTLAANREDPQIDVLQTLYESVHSVILTHVFGRAERTTETNCVLTHLVYRFLDRNGARYGWKYAEASRLAGLLMPVLQAFAKREPLLSAELKNAAAFADEYVALCIQEFDPFYGCGQACPAGPKRTGPQCLYRFSAETLVRSADFESEFKQASKDPELKADQSCSLNGLGDRLVSITPGFANRVVQFKEQTDQFRSVSLCLLIQGIQQDATLSLVAKKNLTDDVIRVYDADMANQTRLSDRS